MRINFLFLFLLAFSIYVKAQMPDSLLLMPRPASVKINNGSFIFNPDFTIGLEGPSSEKLLAAVNRFYLQMGKRTGIYFSQEFIKSTDNNPNAQLSVRFKKVISPEIGMDESYSLNVSATKIIIDANSDFGAMKGLETLYQLVKSNNASFSCPLVEISDAPRFKWRGLMIDVARHFVSMEVIKRNVEAMAIMKMNVLHLHLSDDEGFRVESKTYPKLQEAGSNGQYYTQEQIKDLVAFAHARGIIVVPEFDLPGHCTAMLAAYPYLASYKANYKPAKRFNLDTIKDINLMKVMKIINSSATPTIDPTKESTYTFFDHFIAEMSTLFPDQYLHLGADENNGIAWKQNPEIAAYMQANKIKNTDELQAYFVKRMYAIAKKYNKRVIGWEELFNAALPNDVIVQKWKPVQTDTLAAKIINHHNQIIVSNGFYLDMHFPAYVYYNNDPVSTNLSPSEAETGILGGEAAMWSELVYSDNEEIRVWPRAAAIAERLWSSAAVNDAGDMYRRLWSADLELNDRALLENSNYLKAIGRLANSQEIEPIKTVFDLYTPVKGYKRLMGLMMPDSKSYANLSSPFVNVADIVHCDSKKRWDFRNLVENYLVKQDTIALSKIKSQLIVWQNNSSKYNVAAGNSPYLNKIKELSDRLSDLASLGLKALGNSASKEDLHKQMDVLKKAQFEVDLSIFPEIEALIEGKLKAEPKAFPIF